MLLLDFSPNMIQIHDALFLLINSWFGDNQLMSYMAVRVEIIISEEDSSCHIWMANDLSVSYHLGPFSDSCSE